MNFISIEINKYIPPAANESVKGVVTLPKFDPDLQLNRVKKAQQCVQLAANEAACRSVESTILRWCSIIRQVCSI